MRATIANFESNVSAINTTIQQSTGFEQEIIPINKTADKHKYNAFFTLFIEPSFFPLSILEK